MGNIAVGMIKSNSRLTQNNEFPFRAFRREVRDENLITAHDVAVYTLRLELKLLDRTGRI